MKDNYQYVMTGRKYFCMQQNFFSLLWYLYLYRKSLQLHTGPTRIRGLKTIGKLIQYRLRLYRDAEVLKLPFYGNLCLPVHRGYKIFNFNQKTVVKIIAPEVDSTEISNEIENVRQASQLDFAPGILALNSSERWYEEDFIDGRPFYSNPRAETDVFFEIYHRDILPCLEKMILLQPPQLVDIHDYASRLQSNLDFHTNLIGKEDNKNIKSITGFIEFMMPRIYQKSSERIPLVFSHGDFSLANILQTENGIKVIDWEDASYRNPLYDLYNYFLTESYYKRTTKSLQPEILKAIKPLQLRIIQKSPEVAASPGFFSDVYRWLYYLERLCVLLERELSPKVLEVVSRSIDVFYTNEAHFR